MFNRIALIELSYPELLAVLLLLAILIFEIVMFVHVIRNRKIAFNEKVLWAIGMLVLHPFVAIAYYFVHYRSST
ncbi:MAG TPA: hypothetical protein VGS08_04000 [Candidatus Saccharimonadales bacterium]|nr:hypothetical protein [Candidatus Saccharimonadales bacterium]